jgi:hypothetical protein
VAAEAAAAAVAAVAAAAAVARQPPAAAAMAASGVRSGSCGCSHSTGGCSCRVSLNSSSSGGRCRSSHSTSADDAGLQKLEAMSGGMRTPAVVGRCCWEGCGSTVAAEASQHKLWQRLQQRWLYVRMTCGSELCVLMVELGA